MLKNKSSQTKYTSHSSSKRIYAIWHNNQSQAYATYTEMFIGQTVDRVHCKLNEKIIKVSNYKLNPLAS